VVLAVEQDLSVHCPSITIVYCIHTAKDIIQLLSLAGSPITVVLALWLIQFQENRLNRGTKYIGNGKNWQFLTEIVISRRWYYIGPWLVWNVNKKS